MEKKYYFYDDKAILWTDENNEMQGKVFEEDELMQAFASTLKEMRTSAGLSLPQLAKAMQIPQATLSAYELKTRTPSLLQAIRICAYFECSIEDFIAYGLGIGAFDVVENFLKRINFGKN